MNGPGRLQLLASVLGECHKNHALVTLTPLDEISLLHPRKLVGQPAFIPAHALGQPLLTHLPIAYSGEPGQDSEVRPRKPGRFGDIAPHPAHHILTHKFEGMPDTEFVRGERLDGHVSSKAYQNVVDTTTCQV
jgi:hypothetical protein